MASCAGVGAMREAMAPLWRVPAYEADLAFYLGDSWRAQIPSSPAIEVGRLHAGRRAPPLA
jgi:hypothetical protein